jgi:hypothetical protein
MTAIFSIIQKVFLYFLLVFIGLYAGMLFFHEMCPVETQLTPIEYAKYWKIVDGTFMHNRMAIMGPLIMATFILTVLAFLKNWKSLAFVFLILAFIAFALDISFTLREQMRINVFINEIDLKNLTEIHAKQLAGSQIKAIANFQNRFVYGMISFLLLCVVPFFLPKLNKRKTKI